MLFPLYKNKELQVNILCIYTTADRQQILRAKEPTLQEHVKVSKGRFCFENPHPVVYYLKKVITRFETSSLPSCYIQLTTPSKPHSTNKQNLQHQFVLIQHNLGNFL